MTYEEVKELHYIAPMENLLSICTRGILSHLAAGDIQHRSVAMAAVQVRRSDRRVPNGLMLHEYANLYICARNPMMYLRRSDHEGICVVRVSPTVLQLPGVVISDGNASSDYVRFGGFPEGLVSVDKELVLAQYWTHSDHYETMRHKTAKCAEVLVPRVVGTRFLLGAYVSGAGALQKVEEMGVPLAADINPHIFFR